MNTGSSGGIPEGPSQVQDNHVIWGSIRRSADDISNCDVQSCHDWSGSALENVVYKDWSTSAENSNSHERGFNPGATADEGLPEAWKNKNASEQEVLLKHGLWSVGSQGHVDGLCKPCSYAHTRKGCKSGFNCNFCHLPHINASNHNGNRPSMEKRAKCKEMAEILHGMYKDRLDVFSGLPKEVTSQSIYMQRILARKDRNQPEHGQAPAVKEAQDPVQKPISATMKRRSELTRKFLQEIAAASAAEDGVPRPVNANKQQQSNLVSL